MWDYLAFFKTEPNLSNLCFLLKTFILLVFFKNSINEDIALSQTKIKFIKLNLHGKMKRIFFLLMNSNQLELYKHNGQEF